MGHKGVDSSASEKWFVFPNVPREGKKCVCIIVCAHVHMQVSLREGEWHVGKYVDKVGT